MYYIAASSLSRHNHIILLLTTIYLLIITWRIMPQILKMICNGNLESTET